jgi:hypothetical protein
MRASLVFLALAVLATSCSKSSTCDPNKASSCPSGEVCEKVLGGSLQCFEPVELSGMVFDLGTRAGISGARVVPLSIQGAPLGTAAFSGADGGYVLQIPSMRTDAGTPISQQVVLTAQAQNYEPFPAGIRVSIPIDTATAASSGSGRPYLVDSGLTDIGLTALPAAERGLPSVSGTVETDGGQHGVVVSLEADGGTAVADSQGAFTVFNVPSGSYSAQAFTQGVNYVPTAVTVGSSSVTGVKIVRSSAPTATLSGDIILRRGAAPADVQLVLASTFNSVTYRGVTVPGLNLNNISGSFTLSGIPDGTYYVLGAHNTPGDCRDPAATGNTAIPLVTVTGGQPSSTAQFAVTASIGIVSPGGSAAIDVVSATPTFSWNTFSSAATYDLTVFDSQGNIVWQQTGLPASSGTQSLTYAGPALTSGTTYQWRVKAISTGATPLSTSEDLRGIFQVQ